MLTKEQSEKLLFPFPDVREIQKDMVESVYDALEKKSNLIVHAPTGIGKTAAALSPALAYAIKNNKTIFFLTSRHTQHYIAIETLKQIKRKHGASFNAVDIIGRQGMCLLPHIEELYANEFAEFCNSQREDEKCEFYVNVRQKSKTTVKAKQVLDELKNSIYHTEELVNKCKNEKICAYEISLLLAKNADVIVADYYHIFHPNIREMFLKKTGKELKDSIIIVDEAHTLPERVRDLMTAKLSNLMIKRAIQEAKKFGYKETIANLSAIQDVVNHISATVLVNEQKIVDKNYFANKIKLIKDYDELIADLSFIADNVREKQRQSYIGSVAKFLEAWPGQDEGFVRIIDYKEMKTQPLVTLSYRCLDPSFVTRDVIKEALSTVAMSGTLTPTNMYRDLLAFPKNTVEKTFKSPFPEKNRLNFIVTDVTTKFSMRNETQYEKIAGRCVDITDAVKGNIAFFFPSYLLIDNVKRYLSQKTNRKIIVEKPVLTKKEKNELLEQFKKHKNSGALLLAVASGSFSQGIDLPGDLLKAVVVVGLPLPVPDLETKALITYYDKKFGNGWEYGYVLPAFIKTIQAAGRCIRSETDRGVVVFLDARYAWQSYLKYFPADWEIKTNRNYIEEIKSFFDRIDT